MRAGEGAGVPRMTCLQSRSATLAGCDRFAKMFKAWCIGRGTYHSKWCVEIRGLVGRI